MKRRYGNEDGIQKVRDKVREPFGQMPAWHLKYKVYRGLGRNDLAVLLTLCLMADNKSHESWPTVKAISKNSGVYPSSVAQAIKNLSMRDVVEVTEVGNRNNYRIIFTPPEWVIESGGFPFDIKRQRISRKSTPLARDRKGKFTQCPKDSDLSNGNHTPRITEVAIP